MSPTFNENILRARDRGTCPRATFNENILRDRDRGTFPRLLTSTYFVIEIVGRVPAFSREQLRDRIIHAVHGRESYDSVDTDVAIFAIRFHHVEPHRKSNSRWANQEIGLPKKDFGLSDWFMKQTNRAGIVEGNIT